MIPASRRKRGVVLRWLMRDFDAERRYSEVQVNEVIQTRHPDVATLRRELVSHQMLAREDGVYWRRPEADWKEGGAA